MSLAAREPVYSAALAWALEAENGKLKKMLADKLLELDVLKEINSKKW